MGYSGTGSCGAESMRGTVRVRIDIKSTLARLLDTGDVIDAEDLPALPAPDDYAGD